MNKLSILIVDDSEELLHGLALVMRHAGYHVWTAINGHAALDMIQEHVPDIIICDVMMPYPDGFELREILSRDEKLSGIPFIFLTAMGTQTGKLQGLAAGADDYITKPFDNRELILRVQSVLRRVDVSRQQALLEVEEQMNMLRHEVVKNMTHEMRTPLAQILSTLELAITNRFIDPQAQKDFVQSALSNARVLQNLVEDFLLLVNIEQGEVNTYRQEIRQNFDFRQPIERLQERYENKHLQVRVQVQETETIYAPRREFRRIIEHMVDNALKFSHDGGRVSVWLRAIGQGGCVCSVRDEGPGIPLDLQEKVFEQYYQISQGHAREYGGLGLGLYIARQLARTWGGDVRIVDMEKGGCHVQLMIPPLVTLPLPDEP